MIPLYADWVFLFYQKNIREDTAHHDRLREWNFSMDQGQSSRLYADLVNELSSKCNSRRSCHSLLARQYSQTLH